MEKIELKHVVPHVFAARREWASQVWNVEIGFERGGLYLVEADSGTGKSTLCSYLQGYRHDYAGRVLMDGRDVRTFKTREWVDLRTRHVAMLFQELRLFPELTAAENVEIKNRLTHAVSKEKIESWFERLGIRNKMEQRLGRMSFGQQQRVAMMRALAQPFDFLVVDEPISHLDDANAAAMASIMMEEAQERGAGVIVTSIGRHMPLKYDKVLKL